MSPLEEQFCVFKIFEMSAIFKMAAKARYKKWALKIQHCPISSKFDNISKILKTQNCSSNGDISLCQILCLYHYSFRSQLIADIEIFLAVTIFKMVATIPQKFNIVRYHQNLICGQIMMSRIDSRH
jgi:hypothetical protein